MCIVEKRTSKSLLSDGKVSTDERAATYEGPENMSIRENVAFKSFIEEINQGIRLISEHFQQTSKIKLLGGTFYFKLDKTDQLVLTLATNVKIDRPD